MRDWRRSSGRECRILQVAVVGAHQCAFAPKFAFASAIALPLRILR